MMNKRFLLTAFAITAVTVSSSLLSITYKDVIENNLQEERKLFRAADEAAREAWAELDAANKRLERATLSPNFNASEYAARLNEAKEAEAKWEVAEKAREDIRNNRPSSLDPYFKKEKTSSKSTTTDDTISSIKAIAANQWVKRTACVLAICTIYTVLFSGNNRSNESDEKKNDHE